MPRPDAAADANSTPVDARADTVTVNPTDASSLIDGSDATSGD